MRIDIRRLFSRGIQNPREMFGLLANLPKLIKLFIRLFKDPRTPFHLKLIVILAVVYTISPIDILPELLLPLIGAVDDLIILIAAIRYFFKKCPPELIAEHVQAIEAERRK